jgi:hypothetical protein
MPLFTRSSAATLQIQTSRSSSPSLRFCKSRLRPLLPSSRAGSTGPACSTVGSTRPIRADSVRSIPQPPRNILGHRNTSMPPSHRSRLTPPLAAAGRDGHCAAAGAGRRGGGDGGGGGAGGARAGHLQHAPPRAGPLRRHLGLHALGGPLSASPPDRLLARAHVRTCVRVCVRLCVRARVRARSSPARPP